MPSQNSHSSATSITRKFHNLRQVTLITQTRHAKESYLLCLLIQPMNQDIKESLIKVQKNSNKVYTIIKKLNVIQTTIVVKIIMRNQPSIQLKQIKNTLVEGHCKLKEIRIMVHLPKLLDQSNMMLKTDSQKIQVLLNLTATFHLHQLCGFT